MSTDDVIEAGDYVSYQLNGSDGPANWLELGCGYVVSIDDDYAKIRNGDRVVRALVSKCEMRSKQYKLDV
jgi:hypothetical protein